MRRFRNAKIIATLGPATCTPEKIRTLFDAGADVFRLNFSHGTWEEHAQYIRIIREVEDAVQRPISIMADLQGPKLRVGEFESSSIFLEAGHSFQFDLDSKLGDQERVCFPHPEIFSSLVPGVECLLDDGRIRVCVEENKGNKIRVRVCIGGQLSSHKGINVPKVTLPIQALTKKDKEDLAFVLEKEVDWVALSFVQTEEDIAEARSLIGNRAKIIAKLEKPKAIEKLQGIVESADGIIVARGDLGVEMLPEDVPCVQKQIIRACREAGKPVIVATQMLESMVHCPFPTRAEASDVATAIFEGVDGVMLSAESAAGHYPVEAVQMMGRIVARTEQDLSYRLLMDKHRPAPQHTIADAMTASARQVAHTIKVPAIVSFSETGNAALRAARERPESPVLCLTPNVKVARYLSLAWGIHAVVIPHISNILEMVHQACLSALEQEFATHEDDIVIIAGIPFGASGGTNVLRVAKVGLYLIPPTSSPR